MSDGFIRAHTIDDFREMQRGCDPEVARLGRTIAWIEPTGRYHEIQPWVSALAATTATRVDWVAGGQFEGYGKVLLIGDFVDYARVVDAMQAHENTLKGALQIEPFDENWVAPQ
jgi:hypothetical protein